MSVVDELRKRLTLQYVVDCKCGGCSCVPDELIRETIQEIEYLDWAIFFNSGDETDKRLMNKTPFPDARAAVNSIEAAAIKRHEARLKRDAD